MPVWSGEPLPYNAIAIRESGGMCWVRVNACGQILASSAVTCVWTGSPRFHDWFVRLYPDVVIAPLPERAWRTLP